jgi:DNA-binding winged helix-turn-helix (wHTH) protein
VSVRFGPFEVDVERRQLLEDNGEIHLTPKAFDLLALLVAEAPRVVRKDELHERLWRGTFVSDATLVGLIKELRRALHDRKAQTPIIRTAHGVGYAFAGTLERVAPARADVTHWIVAGTRRVVLHDGEHLIGREAAATVLLDIAGVSRRHARILIANHRATLEDLGSKNGTRVFERRIAGRVVLHDGDQIQVGPIGIIYQTCPGREHGRRNGVHPGRSSGVQHHPQERRRLPNHPKQTPFEARPRLA